MAGLRERRALSIGIDARDQVAGNLVGVEEEQEEELVLLPKVSAT
jgi:hypothetical protein